MAEHADNKGANPPQASPKKQLETYKKVKVLGKGSFGKAFLVTCGSDGVSVCSFTAAMQDSLHARRVDTFDQDLTLFLVTSHTPWLRRSTSRR